MSHIPRKRFGQNFLADSEVIRNIVSAIAPRTDDVMVEIGPGLGAITAPLLQKLKHLHVVEIDRDLVARLKQQYSPQQLTIHQCDALRFDFASLGGRIRIVGNLPYNISTPLLFRLIQFMPHIADIHFMLQKEVVERMVASPSAPQYGRLSVMLQYRFDMECLFTVPPQAFQPAPKVESAFLRMVPLAAPRKAARDEELLAKVVTAAFAMRRKTLRNTLHAYLSAEELAQLGIDASLRAENLGVDDFVKMANYLQSRVR